MKIISFAWTTAALLAGRKTCTRRAWSEDYAKRFKQGDLVAAYDRNPRFGGKQVATIRLTRDPYLENTADMPLGDYVHEGLNYMEEQGLKIQGQHPYDFFSAWKAMAELVWVVRFEVVKE